VSGISAEGVSVGFSIKLHFMTFSSLRIQRCLVSLHAQKSLKCKCLTGRVVCGNLS